jgi:hypothetical protein
MLLDNDPGRFCLRQIVALQPCVLWPGILENYVCRVICPAFLVWFWYVFSLEQSLMCEMWA